MPIIAFPPLFEINNPAENYLRWESIVRGLFENFKFNYEILGTSPLPENDNDIHPYKFLSSIEGYSPKEYYFDEKNHVHFNSFIGYSHPFTAYPMGKSLAYHHFTLETYQFVWKLPLYYITNWTESFPLLFSTENNYFLESCNSTFLEGGQYLGTQSYPILCERHQAVFKPDYFIRSNLPPSLLINTFSLKAENIHIPEQIIKTLNFCLKIFWEAVLIQEALMEIFGRSPDKNEQIEYILKNWDYPNGEMIRGLPLYRLNLLSFLYLNLHPAATALCYGLYRNKYGVMSSHRTAFYVKYDDRIIALKDFLEDNCRTMIDRLNDHLSNDIAHDDRLTSVIQDKIKAALDLARMFGVGYQTNNEKGNNVHINSPKDFKPVNAHPALQDIDFMVEHNANSPFWRIFYDYCGDWWSFKEMEEILAGKGVEWERLKNSPRSLIVHMFHKYAAHFWKENLNKLALEGEIPGIIEARYKSILNL